VFDKKLKEVEDTMKSDRQPTFLPPASNARRHRLILMLSEEEYTALARAGDLLERTPTDIVRYAFETLVLPGIMRETAYLATDTTRPPVVAQPRRTRPKRTPTTPLPNASDTPHDVLETVDRVPIAQTVLPDHRVADTTSPSTPDQLIDRKDLDTISR